jgi:hypothetical protein
VRFFRELSRLPRWEATVLALSMAAMAGWFAGKASEADRDGLIAVTTVPADATVLVDNIRVGRSSVIAVTLEVSPDTGFELTSEPPGELVWLDGTPLGTTGDWQMRTNFRASAIAPGHHVLEIRSARFKDWRNVVEVEPGMIRKIHAILIPRRDLDRVTR